MEKINFNYSLKNIPTPSRSSYQLKLIDKIESVIKRMRWKAFFFLKDNNSNETVRETFGFKSKRHPASERSRYRLSKNCIIYCAITYCFEEFC